MDNLRQQQLRQISMHIAIIGAMEQEIALLQERLKKRTQHRDPLGITFSHGLLYGLQVTIVQCGIGKVAAALGTTVLLERYRPTLVINTGSAGGLLHTLVVGDIVIAEQLCYHDADATAIGYPLGQLPYCPKTFKTDARFIDLAFCCAEQLPFETTIGMVCSGDCFVATNSKRTQLRHHFPNAVAVEMEAASIAHVCLRYQTPWMVVRAISDAADEQSCNSFDRFLQLAAKNGCDLVTSIIQKIAQEPAWHATIACNTALPGSMLL